MTIRRTALLEFIKRHGMAVEASASTTGAPQAAMVAIVVGDGFELLFDTIQASRRAENLRRNPRVAFVIEGWTPGDKRSVQYEGIADEPSGADLERLKRVYFGRVSGGGGPGNRLGPDGLFYGYGLKVATRLGPRPVAPEEGPGAVDRLDGVEVVAAGAGGGSGAGPASY